MAQKKEKTLNPQNTEGEVTPGISGNGSSNDSQENKEKKVDEKTKEVKLQREVYEKEKELEEKDREIEELRREVEFAKRQGKKDFPESDELATLRAQIDQLSRQVVSGARGEKSLFRIPIASDVQDEWRTFTARSIFYVVGSYLDNNGIERIPPHKLIVFTYQASDIRKDGREEVIKNFSQYSTNLKTEIEYLRKHPHYGITFSENTNEMMSEDVKDTQFKVMAANQLSAMAPEVIFERAKELKIPNFAEKSAEELRFVIVHEMAKQYKKENEALQADILRRRMLASVALTNKEE